MSGSVPRVRVEFYGLARLRAGRTELWADAGTLGAVLTTADAACPDLRALRDDVLAGEYLVSLDGVHFTADLNEPLRAGSCVLVMGADAGG